MISKLMILISLLFLSPIAQSKSYGPQKGDTFPHFTTKDIVGKSVDTKALSAQGPLVVLFYRGGWCPFCSRQIQGVNMEVLPIIKKNKGKIVAISVDQASSAQDTLDRLNMSWHIVSDSKAKIVKDFGLDFVVPKERVKALKTKNIDLEKASGETHNILPIPAIYVVGKDGSIKYAYANKNYKIRASNKEVVKAIEALK